MSGFDSLGEVKKVWGVFSSTQQAIKKGVNAHQQRQQRKEAEERYRRQREEQEELLRNPPPVHGSGAWASPGDLARYLKGGEAFNNPRSVLLGALKDEAGIVRFVHW